jgi:hypothetical protein
MINCRWKRLLGVKYNGIMHLGNFTKKWFGPYKIKFCLPNNNVLLLTLDKFDPNPVLVNVNKLKPYQFMDEKTHTIYI